MKILKLIGLSFLSYLGMILFVVVLVLVTLFTYFSLQHLIVLRGDYLLSETSPANILAVVMIMLLIAFKLIQLKDKLFSKKEESVEPAEYMDENQSYIIPIIIEEDSRFYIFLVKQINRLSISKSKILKIFRIIKICYILTLIIAICWGMTSYTILYKDSIKISSPLHPFTFIETYDYNQIKSIAVGVSSSGGGYIPYYKITINNKTVDLFVGSISDKGNIPREEVLINLDINLKELGIPKTIDKSNLEKSSKGLDRNYVKDVEKLFQ